MNGLVKKTWLPVLIVALVAIDLSTVEEVDSKRAQVLPTVDKKMLGEAQVAIACSHCIEAAAARDEVISYEQVDAIVKRAIRLDDSARNLAAVVEKGDWVAIKVNIVTAPLVVNGRKRTAFWDSGVAHWGQATDLRVVKSVLDYLVNEQGDARRIPKQADPRGAGGLERVGCRPPRGAARAGHLRRHSPPRRANTVAR